MEGRGALPPNTPTRGRGRGRGRGAPRGLGGFSRNLTRSVSTNSLRGKSKAVDSQQKRSRELPAMPREAENVNGSYNDNQLAELKPCEVTPPPPLEPHPVELSPPPPIEPHPCEKELNQPPPLEPHPAERNQAIQTPTKSRGPPARPPPPVIPKKTPQASATNDKNTSVAPVYAPPPAVIGAPPPPAVQGTPPRPRNEITSPRTRGEVPARGRGRGTRVRGRGAPRGRGGAPKIVDPNTAITFIIAEPSPVEASEWYPLIDLYIHNEYIVTKAAIKATSSSELDILAPALVNAFAASKDIFGLLTPIMQEEVASTEQAGTLFRGNCIASKTLSAYCRAIGTEFLKSMLLGPITYIAECPSNYEVNPAKLPPGENLEFNIQHLKEAIHFFLKNIILALPQCPPIIRKLCKDLRELVKKSFPESTYTVIGGFFFLRFVGPAIVSPNGYDVYEWKLEPQASRALVLISKVIQNIGNGVEFGKKEAYMLPLNDLIVEKIPEVNHFFDELASPKGVAKPPHIAVNDHLMKKLHSHTFLIQNKILKCISALETERGLVNGSEMKNFQSTIDFLGIPELLEGKDIKALKKQIKQRKKQQLKNKK